MLGEWWQHAELRAAWDFFGLGEEENRGMQGKIKVSVFLREYVGPASFVPQVLCINSTSVPFSRARQREKDV